MAHYRTTAVTAFVDWNSQIHGAKAPFGDCREVAIRTLDHVGRIIGRTLTRVDQAHRFDVSLRIYHGWYKGFEPTENRRALATIASTTDFPGLSGKINVLIRPEFSYGDRLVSALDKRLHPRLGIHLPNTLHRDSRADEFEENMVDTAIAADVVDLAHRDTERWILVLGEDDDLIPPAFTAEAIRGQRGGRTIIVRKRKEGQFLKLQGLLEAL